MYFLPLSEGIVYIHLFFKHLQSSYLGGLFCFRFVVVVFVAVVLVIYTEYEGVY